MIKGAKNKIFFSNFSNHKQENNFQVILFTDGIQSYAVFTYQCGELNWIGSSRGAVIGFSASSTLFANHPLSRKPNVNDISCRNQMCSPWSNVVYQINKNLGIYTNSS